MIKNMILTATLLLAFLIAGLFIFAALQSVFEKEKRAAKKFLWLAIGLFIPFFIAAYAGFTLMGAIFSTLLILMIIIIFLPVSNPPVFNNMVPNSRFDERDTMFARNDLVPGSENFKDYYNLRPENLEPDNQFRSLPGLLSSQARYFHPAGFASAGAVFTATAHLKPLIQGKPSGQTYNISADDLTGYIKRWSKKLGAEDCGITELKDYHVYSHKGRGRSYGKKIEIKHKYAIAFTVEMDKAMINGGPAASTVMESARQYFNSGAIAVQTAEFLRLMGHDASAHIDANYEVICPLVARDAGLGEIGRMGILMTPKLGPRVRISVVTTDAPLISDEPKADFSVIDFCRRCQKCAAVCPARAIPYHDPEITDGVLRWQINSEACYTFWCQAGTDCSRCMSVCPYSHSDNLMHNFVRGAIKRSGLFRKLAVKLDDYIYGIKPYPKPLPEWMKITGNF
ncbi:MAG: reductive dehalogenase domain-containing protein [Calditrichaceae bacterium]